MWSGTQPLASPTYLANSSLHEPIVGSSQVTVGRGESCSRAALAQTSSSVTILGSGDVAAVGVAFPAMAYDLNDE